MKNCHIGKQYEEIYYMKSYTGFESSKKPIILVQSKRALKVFIRTNDFIAKDNIVM